VDEETGLPVDPDLSRQQTRDSLPGTAVQDVVEGEGDISQKKSRLRAMSETLTSIIGRNRRGKRREDSEGEGDAEADARRDVVGRSYSHDAS